MRKNKKLLALLAVNTLLISPLISFSCAKPQTKNEFRMELEDSIELNNKDINIHELEKLKVLNENVWFNNQEVVFSIRNPEIITSSVTGKQHVELFIAVKDKQTSNVILTLKRNLFDFKAIKEEDWEGIIKKYDTQTKFEYTTPEQIDYNLKIEDDDIKIVNDKAKKVVPKSISSSYDELTISYKLIFATPQAKERESELFIKKIKKDQLGRAVVTFEYGGLDDKKVKNIVTNIYGQIDEPLNLKEGDKVLQGLYLDEERTRKIEFKNGKSEHKFTKNTTLYAEFAAPAVINVLNQKKEKNSDKTITLNSSNKVSKSQLSNKEWGGPAISAKKKVGSWKLIENNQESELDFDEQTGFSTKVFEGGKSYDVYPTYVDAQPAKFILHTQKGKRIGQVNANNGKFPSLTNVDLAKDNPELDGKEPASYYLDKEFKRPISRGLTFKNDTETNVYIKFKDMVKVEMYPINAPSDLYSSPYYFFINSNGDNVKSSQAEEFEPEKYLPDNEKSGKKFYPFDWLVNNLNVRDENPEESESYKFVLRNDPEAGVVDIEDFSTLYKWYSQKDTVQLIAIAQEPYDKKIKRTRGVFLSILDSLKKVNHALTNPKFGVLKEQVQKIFNSTNSSGSDSNNQSSNNDNNQEKWNQISTTKPIDKDQKDYSYIDNYINSYSNGEKNPITLELQINAAIEIVELAVNLLLDGAYTYKQLENFINNLTTRVELLLLATIGSNSNGKRQGARQRQFNRCRHQNLYAKSKIWCY